MDAEHRNTVFDWLRARSFDGERLCTPRRYIYGSLRRWCRANRRDIPPMETVDAAMAAAGYAFVGPERDVLGLRLVNRHEGDIVSHDEPWTPEAAAAVGAFLAAQTFPAEHTVPYGVLFHVLTEWLRRQGTPLWLPDESVKALLQRAGYRVVGSCVHGLNLLPRG